MRGKGFVCFLALVFITACHPRISSEIGTPTSNAENLLSKLSARNQGLKTFKGIGSIRIWNAYGSQKARVAWLGDINGRLRVEILGPSGRSLMKFAYDGKYFYFYSVGGDGIMKKRSRNPSLSRVIDVPVTIRELVFFLGGRFPVYDYRRVEWQKSGASHADRLVLRRFWQGIIEKIVLTEDHAAVASVSIYDWHGLSYQAGLSEYRQRGDFFIPDQIIIKSGDSEGLEIRINRYWPNVDVDDRQFVISPA